MASGPGHSITGIGLEPGPRRRALLAALFAVFVGALDLTVIATVLPRMISDLGINTADVDRYVWVVNAYLLAYIVAIPVVGRLSDIAGRTPVMIGAIVVFIAGSVMCAVANDLGWLIAARTVQGLGGGALLPVTLALVGDLLPPGRRLAAIGLVGAIDTVGWVIGPVWGAAIAGAFGAFDESWRLIFWFNVPVGIVCGALIWRTARAVPETRQRQGRLRDLDLVGAALLGAALLAFNLGLSSGGEAGAISSSGLRAFGGTVNPLAAYVVPLLGGSLVLAALFALWSRHRTSPLVPGDLFRDRRFTGAIFVNFLAGCALIVAMVDAPVAVALTATGSDISAEAALALAPFTLFMAVLAFGGGRVAGRLGDTRTALLGLLMVAAGYAALWAGLRADRVWGMVPGLIIAGAGFGLVIAPIGAAILDAAPERARGSAAALTMVSRLLGMTVGISALTALGVRRLQSLTDRVEPIVRKEGESTALFLVRQNEYLQNIAIPLAIQVLRETFLVAGILALLALIPLRWLRAKRQDGD